jgi:hypothetical protein
LSSATPAWTYLTMHNKLVFLVAGTPRPASYVAAQAYQFAVEDAAKSFIESFFGDGRRLIAADGQDRFVIKIRLYCEAAALRVLLTEKQNNDRYSDLVEEFEKWIFPRTGTAEGIAKLAAIKSAMKDIDRLIFDTKQLSWARNWFAGIGCDETNPVTLALLVHLMGLDTKSFRELIHEIGPPIEGADR